jgi:hypothetical protein
MMNQKQNHILFIFLALALSGLLSCLWIRIPGTSTPVPIYTLAYTPTLEKATPTATFMVGDLGWGKIYGEVTDAATGLPIVGATVTCSHYSYTSPATCNASTLTDQDGIFTFLNIFFHDTDRIQLEVRMQGYVTQTLNVDFLISPWLQSDFALVAETGIPPAVVCTAPACGPYESLVCSAGDCTGGCGLICATPAAICTPPVCAIGTSEVYYCAGTCPAGCGTTCATYTPTP